MKERKSEPNESNQPTQSNQPNQNRKPAHLRKTMLRKVIPYILVGCITSSAVMMAHNEAREVKAVAVVDDVILLTALLAMAGIAYVGVLTQWEEDTEENEELAERIAQQWNWNAKQKGVLLGYIDPETGEYIGALEGTGGNTGSSGDDDNDDDNNKFPTWQKLKEWVAKNNGDIGQALGTGAGLLVGLYASTMLESAEEGAVKAHGLPSNANVALAHMEDMKNQYCQENNIDLSELPYRCVSISQYKSGKLRISMYYVKSDLYILKHPDNTISYGVFKKTSYLRINYLETNSSPNEQVYYNPSSDFGAITNPDPSVYSFVTVYGNVPTCSTLEDCLAYYDNPYPVYPDTYVNPSTIGKSTSLAKKLAETGGNLTESLYKNAMLPTTKQLSQYFEDLNNAENEEEKQKVMDEFVDSLVTPAENPNPNPDNPDNPDKPDNPDNPTNNDIFLADLKHLFPFCIPFDLVDCFKLFNAEPVTPRVEFPIHFGIINYDHTFVIDLKDFDKVAVVCRSTFLIIYMTGLILATRALIKG